MDACWNQIGVWGDRSCGELRSHIHCRNCPVYSSAGRGLLERPAPEGYLEGWTRVLAETEADRSIDSEVLVRSAEVISTIVFRLGSEYLALPVRVFQEVAQNCPVHTLPHRITDLFLGLTSVRGEILPYVSLSALLGIDPDLDRPVAGDLNSPAERATIAASRRSGSRQLGQTGDRSLTYGPPAESAGRSAGSDLARFDGSSPGHPRDRSLSADCTVVLSQGGSSWAVAVDEVCGVQRFLADELRLSPVSVTKATEAYTRGILDWNGHKVSFLDWELLSYALTQKII